MPAKKSTEKSQKTPGDVLEDLKETLRKEGYEPTGNAKVSWSGTEEVATISLKATRKEVTAEA